MQDFSNKRYVFIIVFATIFFFAVGVYVGIQNQPASTIAAVSEDQTPVDLTYFWKVWDTIDDKYPGAEKISNQDRLYGAISGLLDSLGDPYTSFLDPEETKTFQEDISGTFSGVGMEVGIKDKVLTVIAPLKDTPAYKAGIKSGDKIIKIDDTSADGLSVEKAVKLIRGEKGTTVSITILRDGERAPREIKIVRDIINMPTLDTELRTDNIFVVKLYSFSGNAPGLFRAAMKKFWASKTDKLLLDLRGNPGGFLSASVDITSWFLPTGKVIVTEDYSKDKKPTIFRSKGYNILDGKLKLVVLIDGGSASASEIVAGALQDHKKAILVGAQSYGKGSVQEMVDVTDDTILKITVAKWLTPNGISISEKGLTPGYPVTISRDEMAEKKDPQLDKAIELLNNWPGIQ